MKNNLFRKFLAVFLTGTMLAGVGCKDYDDDIDSINKRLDGMDVTVADLETQVNNVKSSIPTLDELNKKVATLTEGLSGVQSDITSINKNIKSLQEAQENLAKLKSELEAYVDEQIKSSEKTLRNELATKEAVSKVEKAVEALKADYDKQLSDINQRIAKLEGADAPKDFTGDIQALKDRLDKLDGTNGEVKALKDRLAALEDIDCITTANLAEEINKLTTAPSWLGDAITTAIAAYQFPYATATEATDATIKSLLEKMGYANQDYKESLVDLIQKNSFSSSDLDSAIAAYESTVKPLIEALAARTFELEGRIQSMVWIPSSLAEANEGILFETSQFITLKDAKNKEKTIALGTQKTPEATIRMRVSPAAAVAKIEKAWKNDKQVVRIVAEPIKMTRAAAVAPAFEITNVVFDTENGTFTVTASTDYKFGSVENETLAIAVNVTIANGNTIGEGETATAAQGIDFTSAYIGCTYADKAALTDADFVVAYTNDKGELTEYDGAAAYATELQYNKEGEKVTFFDGFAVYYKTGDKKAPYARLDTMWSGALASKLIAPDAKKGVATVNPKTNEKSYELKNVSAMILSGKSATSLINDVISSDKFSFLLSDAADAAYTLPILSGDNVKQTVRITAVNTNVETAAAAVAWNYATVTGSKEYAATGIVLNPVLKGEVYNQIKNKTATVTVLNDKNAAVADLAAAISLPSSPDNASMTDTQKADLRLTDAKNLLKAAGSYTVRAEYTLDDLTTVTILIPVNVTGMPAIADQSVTRNDIVIKDGVNDYPVAEKVAALYWNESAMKAAFGSKADFVKAIEAATFAATADKQGSVLKLDGAAGEKNMLVTVGSKAEKNTPYTLTATFKAAWGLDVKFTANVTVKYPTVALTQGLSYNNGAPIVDAQIAGSSFNITGLQLKDVYAYTGNEPGVTVKFVIKDKDAEKAGAKVESDGLTWGNWTKRTIAMEAVVMLGSDYQLSADGQYPFTATLKDPVAKKIDVAAKTLYASNTAADRVMLAELLTLKAMNDANIFDGNGSDGLNAALKAALCINLGKDVKPVVYTLAAGVTLPAGVTFDPQSGLITVEKIEGTIPTDTATLKFDVTYNYWFGQRTAQVTVLVKPESEKPAPEPEA